MFNSFAFIARISHYTYLLTCANSDFQTLQDDRHFV